MCKKAEPIEMPFEGADSCGPKKPCITRVLDPTERISVMGVSHGIKSRRVQRWMQLQRWVCMRPLSIYFVHLFLIVVLFNW